MKTFKDYYSESLSSLNLGQEDLNLPDAMGIGSKRADYILNEFKDYIRSLDIGKHAKRSEIWGGALYHCDPESLTEVLMIGTLIGAFEYSQKVEELKPSNGINSALLKTAALAMAEAVTVAIDNGDYNIATKFVNEFSKLINEEL